MSSSGVSRLAQEHFESNRSLGAADRTAASPPEAAPTLDDDRMSRSKQLGYVE